MRKRNSWASMVRVAGEAARLIWPAAGKICGEDFTECVERGWAVTADELMLTGDGERRGGAARSGNRWTTLLLRGAGAQIHNYERLRAGACHFVSVVCVEEEHG